MKARFLWAILITLLLLSLPTLVAAQPPIQSSTGPTGDGVKGNSTSAAVLWDQPSDGMNAIVAQYFPDFGSGMFSADDFSNAELWHIEFIFVDGAKGSSATGSLPEANSLNWFIYADAAGVPAGYPSAGGELWSHTCLPTDPEVSISGADSDQVTLDIVQAQGAPLFLSPGTYWLVFCPSLDFGLYGQWFWDTASTTNLAIAQVIDPIDFFGMGWISWSPWTEIDPSAYDAAFRLEGTTGPIVGVGGEAYPVNKIQVLTPWIASLVLLAVGTVWFASRRRRAQG